MNRYGRFNLIVKTTWCAIVGHDLAHLSVEINGETYVLRSCYRCSHLLVPAERAL